MQRACKLALLFSAALCFSIRADDIHQYQNEHFHVKIEEPGALPSNGKLGLAPKQEDEMDEMDLDLLAQEIVEAVREKNVERVELLLTKGADATMVLEDFTLPTLLHLAVEFNSLEIVKMLVREGADVNAVDKFGMTPLHYAAFSGSAPIAKYLLKLGSNPDAQDIEESTPLHLSPFGRNKEIMELLVRFGADVSLQDMGGDTALHQAAEQGYPDMVKTLLDLGIDPDIQDEGGSMAIEEICEDAPSCSESIRRQIVALLDQGK